MVEMPFVLEEVMLLLDLKRIGLMSAREGKGENADLNAAIRGVGEEKPRKGQDRHRRGGREVVPQM
jgi:hypothetical protein